MFGDNVIDSYGNDIETTRYETELAEVILNSPEYFKDVFLKINQSINRVIEFNVDDRRFNMCLFSVFSLLQESFPGYNNMEKLLSSDFDIPASDLFQKLFFENLIDRAKIPNKAAVVDSERTLSQLIQDKFYQSPEFTKSLAKHYRPESLFTNRRVELEAEEISTTTKFGIIDKDYTDEKYRNYFFKPFEPAQNQFIRDPNASFYGLMMRRKFPFLSGPSGTLGICLSNMMRLDSYTTKEIKAYIMGLTASLVARGHHSFYEVMCVAEYVGFKIDFEKTGHEFYQQILTDDFKEGEAYLDFTNNYNNDDYLEETNSL